MKTLFYTAMSLDGFLATDDDSIAFLDEVPHPSKDTYTPMMEKVGAICMGRSTYEFLLKHIETGGDWPYAEHSVWVFTHQDFAPRAGVTFTSDDVASVHAEMAKAAAGKDVWICGGGGLAAKFHVAGLLDELRITVAAKTLGSGKPLFPVEGNFRFVSAEQLGEGFVELRLVPTT